MRRKPLIQAFALPYHIESSKSHETIVGEPLSSFFRISFQPWDGVHLPKIKEAHYLLFFEYPPPSNIMNNRGNKIIWVPMWDQIKNKNQLWWNTLPKSIKIVALSNEVNSRARSVGLHTLRLKYYTNPRQMKRASWKNKRVLFYWNRIGLLGKEDILKLCKVLKIDTLYFQNQIDPGILKSFNYSLPSKLGNTSVIRLPYYLSRNEYIHILERSNIYIAPRIYEGIGISFIEALARGCCVFAVNAPTMNEYITHKKNGYLLRCRKDEGFVPHLKRAIGIRIPKELGGVRQQIKLSVDWNELENLEIEKLGNCARENSKIGYAVWQSKLKRYAQFLTDW